jgi:hypothetical protein
MNITASTAMMANDLIVVFMGNSFLSLCVAEQRSGDFNLRRCRRRWLRKTETQTPCCIIKYNLLLNNQAKAFETAASCRHSDRQ